MNVVPFPRRPEPLPVVAAWLEFNPVLKAYYESLLTAAQLWLGLPMLLMPGVFRTGRPEVIVLGVPANPEPMRDGETIEDFVRRRPDLWDTGYRMYLTPYERGELAAAE